MEMTKIKAEAINEKANVLLKEKREQIEILMAEMQYILESFSDEDSNHETDERSTIKVMNNAQTTIRQTGFDVDILSETQQIIEALTPARERVRETTSLSSKTGVSQNIRLTFLILGVVPKEFKIKS